MAAFCEHLIQYVGVHGIGSGGRVLKINLTAILCKIIEDKDWWQRVCVCVCVWGVQLYVYVCLQACQQFSGNSLVFLALFIQALLKRTKHWNISSCQKKSEVVPNNVWDSLSCKVSNLQSSHCLPRVTVCLCFVKHQSMKILFCSLHFLF